MTELELQMKKKLASLALALVLCLKNLEVVGITTVGGNVGLASTQRNTRYVTEVTGYTHVPVFAGYDRPMLEPLRDHMELVERAREAMAKAGVTPMELPIRGGTDGARLSYMGLPCPNLGTGGFNFHGPYECISVEGMDSAVAVLRNIVALYAGA